MRLANFANNSLPGRALTTTGASPVEVEPTSSLSESASVNSSNTALSGASATTTTFASGALHDVPDDIMSVLQGNIDASSESGSLLSESAKEDDVTKMSPGQIDSLAKQGKLSAAQLSKLMKMDDEFVKRFIEMMRSMSIKQRKMMLKMLMEELKNLMRMMMLLTAMGAKIPPAMLKRIKRLEALIQALQQSLPPDGKSGTTTAEAGITGGLSVDTGGADLGGGGADPGGGDVGGSDVGSLI